MVFLFSFQAGMSQSRAEFPWSGYKELDRGINFDFSVSITLRSKQNGCQLGDDSLKCIFMKEILHILIKFSLKFAPQCLHCHHWFR